MEDEALKPGPKRSRWKMLAFTLVAVASTIVLGALATEGLFHVLSKTVTLRPGQGPRPPVNDSRLLIRCIGDSYTFGIGVSDENLSYPLQLRTLLEEKYPTKKTSVWNEGVPGYNSSDMLQVMRDGLENRPDLPTVYIVLLAHNNNWNMHQSSLLKQGGGPISETRWLKILGSVEGIRLGKLATITVLRGKAFFDGIAEQGNMLATQAPRLLDPKVPEQREFLEQWLALDMKQMAELAKANNGTVLFATYHLNWDQEIYLKIASQSGERYCKKPKHGRHWESYGWVSETRWHLNEKGYSVFAEHIADCLDSHGLLDWPR